MLRSEIIINPTKLLFVGTILLYALFLKASSSSKTSFTTNETEDTRHCDTKVCESIVTKCMFTEKCQCNFRTDASCAKDCVDCLEEKFGKCCACVGLCPALEEAVDSSHVGDIVVESRYEELYETLTETDDIHGRWSVVTNLAGFKTFHPELGQIEIAHRRRSEPSGGQNFSTTLLSHDENLSRQKCILAFINKHLHMNQCRRYCTSMGASHFRWFHETGCCECVGKYCLNYGVAEPRCIIEPD